MLFITDGRRSRHLPVVFHAARRSTQDVPGGWWLATVDLPVDWGRAGGTSKSCPPAHPAPPLAPTPPPSYYYFASAFIAIPSTQLTATSLAECSLCRPPSWSLHTGHSFTMCDIVRTIPHPHLSEDARPHLCRFAAQRPWPVQKRQVTGW